nr:hypothetical protein [Gemmatimonadales bacterium]
MGDTLDVATTKPMGPGAKGSIPAGTHYYGIAKGALTPADGDGSAPAAGQCAGTHDGELSPAFDGAHPAAKHEYDDRILARRKVADAEHALRERDGVR